MGKLRYVMAFLVILGLFLVSGCNFPGRGEQQTPEPQKPQGQEPQKEAKDYYVGMDAPVQGLQDWVDRYNKYDGVFLQKIDGYQVLLISMGEKFTGGYEVAIKEVREETDKWTVEVERIEPGNQDVTTQVINYPTKVISFKDDGKPVEVLQYQGDTVPAKGAEIVEIPEGKKLPVSKSFIIFTPLEGEQIDNPVTIKGKARVFEANFRVHIEDGHNYLVEKIIMADEGGPGWGNFEAELTYDKPTNPQGHIIFSYENMENGKMIEELMLPVKFKE